MKICTDETILALFFRRIEELKLEGKTKQQIGALLCVDAFKNNMANFQLNDMIDLIFVTEKFDEDEDDNS